MSNLTDFIFKNKEMKSFTNIRLLTIYGRSRVFAKNISNY